MHLYEEPSQTNKTEPLARKTQLKEEEVGEQRLSSITKVEAGQMPEARLSEDGASQSGTDEDATPTRSKWRAEERDGAMQAVHGHSRQESDLLRGGE